jgi:hypothetical protein
MNKLIAATLASLAALGLATDRAAAWCHHGCDQCCTTICLRQYNAFTPICYGSLSCDGCCPLNITSCCPGGHFGCGPTGYGPPPYGMNGGYGPGFPGMTFNGYPPAMSGQVTAPGTTTESPAPPATMPDAGSPSFQAPMPTPKENPPAAGSGPTAQNRLMGTPAGMVQYAGYRPPYYPGYYPGYAPVMPAYRYGMPMGGMMPGYWAPPTPAAMGR